MKHEVILTKENHLDSGKTVTQVLHLDTEVIVTRHEVLVDGKPSGTIMNDFVVGKLEDDTDINQWLRNIYPDWEISPIELRY